MSEEIKNPLPNFHSARIASPNLFVRIVQLQELPNGIRILGGPLKSDPQGSGKPQSYRFPRDKFTVSEAKTWLKDHDIKVILFEPATGEKDMYEDYAPEFIGNINKETADINMFEQIAEGSGQKFADEMEMLNQFGVKKINVNISGPGGSIMEGFPIFWAIRNSEVEVQVNIVGVAASMAGIIAMAGHTITIVDYGKLMIHNPAGSKNPDDKEKEAIQSMKDSLLVILKNRTGKSKDELSAIMDAETWLNPKQALEGGFVDEIVSTKHLEKKKKKQPVAEITNILQSITNNQKPEKMKTVCKYLDLSEDASESAILDAIKKINNDLTDVKGELETEKSELVKAKETIDNQKTTITGFEEKQKELNKTLIEDTVEAAIKDEKFEEKDKEALVEKFENNLEGLKLVLGAVRSPAEIITNKLTGGKGNSVIPEDKKDWGWRKLEEEAPKLAETIRTTNKELYKTLYKAEYGVDLNEESN